MLETWIEDQAARNPKAIALAMGERSYSYGKLAADIRRCAGWLKTLNLTPGSRAALQLSDLYAYWVLFYALEAKQIITVGLYPAPAVDERKVADLGLKYVFSDHPRPEGFGTGWTRINPAWFKIFRRFRDVPLPKRPRCKDDPICIVLSSGTTGAAKKVMLDRAMLETRTEFGREAGIYAQPPGRTLAALPPSSIAGLQLGLGSFADGSALCVREGAEPWADTLLRLSVNVLVLAPIHIDEVLAELPADFAPEVEIAVFVVGGTLSTQTIRHVQARLSRNIIQGYGTTESGGITEGQIGLMSGAEEAAGFVNAWMDVSLIDEAGEEVLSGEAGEVRVRGPTVIAGYLEDDEQTSKSFRAGWYHPGDMATIDPDGVLRVVGRVDDIINIGGRKFVPAAAERFLRTSDATLVDVAVFGAEDRDQGMSIWVAHVGPNALDHRQLSQALSGAPIVFTASVTTIPRNVLGKIERSKLRLQAEAGSLSAHAVAV